MNILAYLGILDKIVLVLLLGVLAFPRKEQL